MQCITKENKNKCKPRLQLWKGQEGGRVGAFLIALLHGPCVVLPIQAGVGLFGPLDQWSIPRKYFYPQWLVRVTTVHTTTKFKCSAPKPTSSEPVPKMWIAMSVQKPQKKLGHVERHREEACEGDRWRQHVEGVGGRGAFEGVCGEDRWRGQVERTSGGHVEGISGEACGDWMRKGLFSLRMSQKHNPGKACEVLK